MSARGPDRNDRVEGRRPGGPERPAIERVPGLDGVRGVAVVAVVAYHLHLVPGGFLGVDVFFVLSGFLVTSLLLAEATGAGRIDLRRFWARRIRRLLPAVLVLVAVVLGAALLLDWPRTRLDSASLDGLATLTWWANWRQASGTSYWAASTPNLFRHAWSLSIEEQFYLVWPLVVAATTAVARRTGRSVRATVGLVATLGFGASATWLVVLARRLGDDELSRVYVGTDTRVLAPLAGCVLACWWSTHRNPPPRSTAAHRVPGRSAALTAGGAAGAALVVLASLVATADVAAGSLYREGGFVVAALAATLLVWAVLTATEGARVPAGRTGPDRSAADGALVVPLRWTTWALPRWLGLRSYGIYLWSWPTQVLVERRFPTAPRWAIVAGVVVLALALAELSHRLVEDPVRRGQGWAGRPVVRRPAWALGLAVPVAVLLLGRGLAEEPPAFEQITTEQAVAVATQAPPTVPPTSATAPGDSVAEPPGPPQRRVMVIGDSVAFTATLYAPAAADLPDGIASLDGRSVIGCGLLAGERYEYRDQERWVSPSQGACVGQLEAERVGLTGKPDLVLAMPGAWEHEPVRSPTGTVYEARSDALGDLLAANLVGRARQAHAVGAGFAMVQWACPGPDQERVRTDPAYIDWFNGIEERAAQQARAEGIDAWVVPTPSEVCVGGDATGAPTAAKLEHSEDGIHFGDTDDTQWFWSTWIAPALRAHPDPTPG